MSRRSILFIVIALILGLGFGFGAIFAGWQIRKPKEEPKPVAEPIQTNPKATQEEPKDQQSQKKAETEEQKKEEYKALLASYYALVPKGIAEEEQETKEFYDDHIEEAAAKGEAEDTRVLLRKMEKQLVTLHAAGAKGAKEWELELFARWKKIEQAKKIRRDIALKGYTPPPD